MASVTTYRVGVVSDTHVPELASSFPEADGGPDGTAHLGYSGAHD